MTTRIAIVGGGYLGIDLARRLEDVAEVSLIERRSHFVHTAALIRSLVRPEWLDRAILPYDKLLKRGRLVRAAATAVDGGGVTLESGERIEADFTVIATGSSNADPWKPGDSSVETLRAAQAEAHGMLNDARHIAIVGAGAVGTELAGEIVHYMPQKSVTLVTDTERLFPEFPRTLGDALRSKLRKAGVRVVTGVTAEDLQSLTRPYKGDLTLSDGQLIDSDVVVPAVGSRGRADLALALPGAEEGSQGRVKVDGYLRPSPELPNVFAAGDAADAGDCMTIVAVSRQEPWLRKALTTLAKGGTLDDVPEYQPWGSPPILIPLGPERGNAWLSYVAAGDLVTRFGKGSHLFVQKYKRILNL